MRRFLRWLAAAALLAPIPTLSACVGEVGGDVEREALPDGGSVGAPPGAAFPDAGSPDVQAASPPEAAPPSPLPDPDPDPSPDPGPDWMVDGVAVCPEAAALRNLPVDSSAALQTCIDRTPVGVALELEAGRYSLAARLRLDRAIALRTRGRAGTAACSTSADHGCAELFALPSFDQPFGMLLATASVSVEHVVLNGNRQGRGGTAAHQGCVTGDNTRGFNAMFQCAGCTLAHSVSIYALCGTGFGVGSPGSGVTIVGNSFAYNGVHTQKDLWADGLTVLDASGSTFSGNTFIDNSDIDLIFGGCQGCLIQNNLIVHTGDPAGGAFAALMIQKWPNTSGNYADVLVSGNVIDCGPHRSCGSGLYIGSESWYPETPYGTLVPGATSGLITQNSIVNAMNALYIAAKGLAIYGNGFNNAHGVAIPSTCGQNLVSATPIVVSPTAASIHFGGENQNQMVVHYSNASWAGCIPNFPAGI
jgi:hypothetical protein